MIRAVGRVPSLSDPRVSYVVTEGPDGLRCECQAFPSWRKRGLPCWHLRVWRAAQGAVARCRDAGHDPTQHTDQPLVCQACLLSVLSAMAGKVKRDYVSKADVKAAQLARREKAAARKAAKQAARRRKKKGAQA